MRNSHGGDNKKPTRSETIEGSGESHPRGERRGFPRHETWQHVEIHHGGTITIGELLDLSNSGARIQLRQGFMPESGKRVKMRLVDGTEIDGFVTWDCGDCFGFKFELNLMEAEDHLHFDHLGFDYLRAKLRLQKRRREGTCCDRRKMPDS